MEENLHQLLFLAMLTRRFLAVDFWAGIYAIR